jgi:putative transposase
MAILAEGDSGLPVGEICRKHGISSSAYYQWRSKYAGMSVAELKRVKELEAENARLKRMYADLAWLNPRRAQNRRTQQATEPNPPQVGQDVFRGLVTMGSVQEPVTKSPAW